VSFERLPESVITLYAELLDQVVQGEAEAVAQGLPPPGSFVSKRVKGNTYWYLQRTVAGRKEQRYLGPESPALLGWLERAREAREDRRSDERRRAELVEMLAAGGAVREQSGAGRVLQALAEARVFRLGAVLVGTRAFLSYGNMLGVRFQERSLRTEDVDIAQDPRVAVALAPGHAPADLPSVLEEADRAFFGVPGLDPREPSTSFKVRGRDLRVDFLTPRRGAADDEPIPLPRLGVAAQPLPFLDYLLEETEQAVILYGSGILATVPHPARFAFRKLWVANRRPAAQQARARKDRLQAQALVEVLLDDRPRDLRRAWEAVPAKRKPYVRAAIDRLEPVLRREVQQVVEGGW
jgi:hypothetical protein